MRLLCFILPFLVPTSTVPVQTHESKPSSIQGHLSTLEPINTFKSWSYTDCGKPSDIIQIKNLTLTPDKPIPGKSNTIAFSGEVKSRIEKGAYILIEVKLALLGIELVKLRLDFCEKIMKGTKVPCPVEPGVYEVEKRVAIPGFIPELEFDVSAQGYTVDNKEMLCLKFDVDFGAAEVPLFVEEL